MIDLLKEYKEMVPEMTDMELERQEKSFWRMFPNYSKRDMKIYELILGELVKRSSIKLFSKN